MDIHDIGRGLWCPVPAMLGVAAVGGVIKRPPSAGLTQTRPSVLLCFNWVTVSSYPSCLLPPCAPQAAGGGGRTALRGGGGAAGGAAGAARAAGGGRTGVGGRSLAFLLAQAHVVDRTVSGPRRQQGNSLLSRRFSEGSGGEHAAKGYVALHCRVCLASRPTAIALVA